MGLELRKSPRLVRTHQSAVASDIGGQNGSQLAFDALYRHRETSSPNAYSLIQNQGAVHGRRFGRMWPLGQRELTIDGGAT
jgi:hypothetical protein